MTRCERSVRLSDVSILSVKGRILRITITSTNNSRRLFYLFRKTRAILNRRTVIKGVIRDSKLPVRVVMQLIAIMGVQLLPLMVTTIISNSSRITVIATLSKTVDTAFRNVIVNNK